jgi:hypothetical protein
MISPLESQPLNLVMEMLENIAKSNDLLLSTNLIDFADDIYKIAYERGAEDEIQRAYHAEMMSPIEDDEEMGDPASFVYNPERDGPAEFVPPKSLRIALESHEQHHAQAKEKFPNLFDEFAERAPKDVQEAMIRILNARTTRAKHEQGLDKV